MNRIIAAILAVIALAIAAWALLYLPGKMSTEAERALAEFKAVLAESAPNLTLRHGSVSGNAMTASVNVDDVALVHSDGGRLEADTLSFSVDPLSRKISGVEAHNLTVLKDDGQANVDAVRIAGLTPETVSLIGLAAERRIGPEVLFQRLALERFQVDGIVATSRGEGEISVRSLAVEDLRDGKIARFDLEGFSVHSRAVQNPGEFVLDGLQVRDLDVGQIAHLGARPKQLPAMVSPIFSGFAFDRLRVTSPSVDIGVEGGGLDASYTVNASGGTYANKATFTIDGIVIEPGRGNRALREFGIDRIRAAVKMVVTGDHASRTMTVEEMSFRFPDLADLDFRIALTDVPADAFKLNHTPEELVAMSGAMADTRLKSASLTFTNARLIQLSLDYMERKQGIDATAYLGAMLAQARSSAAASGDPTQGRFVDEIERFLADPKTLEISAMPEPPLPLSRLQGLSEGDQGAFSRALNLEIKAN